MSLYAVLDGAIKGIFLGKQYGFSRSVFLKEVYFTTISSPRYIFIGQENKYVPGFKCPRLI